MEEINYNECQVEGGIDRFRDIPDLATPELDDYVEPEHAAELPPGIIDEEDEEPLAQAA